MSNNFQTISPIDGSVYLERRHARELEIDRTLNAAQRAQLQWQSVDLGARASICKKAVQYFQENSSALAEQLTWQMGRPIQYTPGEITGGFRERALHMIDIAKSALSEELIEDGLHFKKSIKRNPLGTVMVLAPWNYPYLTSVNAVIPALMAGNTVILKHAQQTPLCAEQYADAFAYAGLPDDVFQYLHVNHAQVARILRDARIDYVSFTGSVAGGHAVQEAVSTRFIRAGLELGGKDPAYVRADADLNHAAEQLADGAFFNSGQSCCGIERIYVHQDIYQEFLEAILAITYQQELDDPLKLDTTLGPMVKPQAAQFVQRQIDAATASGAKTLVDLKAFPHHDLQRGYMAPQILVDVDHTMSFMKEETFGPAVGIMKVANDEEAIRWMNDSKYGLTASIWTNDLEQGETIGRHIQAGTLFVNRCDYLDPALAWCGTKDSGVGVSLSHIGYQQLTRPQSFHIKK